MPRKIDKDVYVEDILTNEEAELLRLAATGESFTIDGWDKYGESWVEHLPRLERYTCTSCKAIYSQEYNPEFNGEAYCEICSHPVELTDSLLYINLASDYLFGWQFQRYQAELYYCPVRDRMIMGGRGCGKTETLAIAHALRTIFWPGHDWLHVAPTLDQAKLTYNFLLKQARSGRFFDIFVEDYRTHPLPEIFLRKWNKNDPGTRWLFRTIGDSLERVRGERVGIVSVDEGFRLYPTDWYVGVLAGTARGVNEYEMNSKPELSEEYQEKVRLIEWELNPVRRAKLLEELDTWVNKSGLAKHTSLTMIGNAPVHLTWWNRWEKGHKSPEMRWSKRWSSYQNLFLSKTQIDFWSQQFTDPDALAVELDATKPKASGDVFPYIDTLFKGDMDEKAVSMIGEPGWVYNTHEDWGLYHYERPPKRGEIYAFGSDPGAGKIPLRNKWVIIGARIDAGPPFEIVYVRMGNLRGEEGSIENWVSAAQDVRDRYPMIENGFAAEAGGTQKHIHTVVWPDDLYIVPLNMNMSKATEVLKLQRMLRGSANYECMYKAPGIPILELELGEYKLKQKPSDPQDSVIALLALTNVVYPFVADEWELQEPEYTEQDFWETKMPNSREVREVSREVRTR